MHCVYDTNGLQLNVGGQHLTAPQVICDIISGSLCPSESNHTSTG